MKVDGLSIPTLDRSAIKNNETVVVIGAFAFAPSVKRLRGLASECLFALNAPGQSQTSIGASMPTPYLARDSSNYQIVLWYW